MGGIDVWTPGCDMEKCVCACVCMGGGGDSEYG